MVLLLLLLLFLFDAAHGTRSRPFACPSNGTVSRFFAILATGKTGVTSGCRRARAPLPVCLLRWLAIRGDAAGAVALEWRTETARRAGRAASMESGVDGEPLSKLSIAPRSRDDARIGAQLDAYGRRVAATPPGMCPLAVQLAMLQASGAQTCGKCVPCRDGIPQLAAMLQRVVDCDADEATPPTCATAPARRASGRRSRARRCARRTWTCPPTSRWPRKAAMPTR